MGKWKKVQLGDICEVLNGFAFQSKNYVLNGFRIIRITNVQRGVIIDDEPKYYTQSQSLKRYELKKDDILMSLTGNVGRVGILSEHLLPAYLNQRVACIRENKEIIQKKYMFFYFNSAGFENQAIVSSKGVAQKNLSTEWLKKFQIPLPPLSVQEQIAEVLDRASALIEKRKEQIEKLDLLVKSQFIEMFGDPVRNPKGWEVKKLGELGILGRGISKHRPRNDPKLLGGIYPLIQTGNVAESELHITKYLSTYSELGLEQSKMWKKGTLCITIAANIAKTAILGFDSCFPDSIVGFLANKTTNNIFIHFWFMFFQKIIESQAPESAQKNINLKILNALEIIQPPIPLQNEFANFVETVEAQKALFQQSLKKLEENYQSLMQKYFRGEIF